MGIVAAPSGTTAPSETAITKKVELNFEDVTKDVLRLAEEAIGEEGSAEMDAPLMESGLDSLSMVTFRNELQFTFKGIDMPPTLVFEYPTIRGLVEYIVSA